MTTLLPRLAVINTLAASGQLQRAQEQPGGVLMDAQDGEFGFDSAPTAGAPKRAERPGLRIGG